MAYVKIGTIRKTLYNAINYIVKDEKTDNKNLVTGVNCLAETATKQMLETRKLSKTEKRGGTILAKHIIQSFAPGEVTADEAHQIGLEYIEKVFGNQYEAVIATHIDREHIHNHIIVNNVSFVTMRCYRDHGLENLKKLRKINDEICQEHNLSIIDQAYETYKQKYKSQTANKDNGVSWYEYQQRRKGKSWKALLQMDIDFAIERAKDWNEFLRLMQKLDYEIKSHSQETGKKLKHLAFRPKDKERFQRVDTLGENYTEERLKARILEKTDVAYMPKDTQANQLSASKYWHKNEIITNSRVDYANSKQTESHAEAYRSWAISHNLKVGMNSYVELRKSGIGLDNEEARNAISQLNSMIKQLNEKQSELMKELKIKEQAIELVHTINTLSAIYQEYKSHNNLDFAGMYQQEIMDYEQAKNALDELYPGENIPSTEQLLAEIDALKGSQVPILDAKAQVNAKLEELKHLTKNVSEFMQTDIQVKQLDVKKPKPKKSKFYEWEL